MARLTSLVGTGWTKVMLDLLNELKALRTFCLGLRSRQSPKISVSSQLWPPVRPVAEVASDSHGNGV